MLTKINDYSIGKSNFSELILFQDHIIGVDENKVAYLDKDELELGKKLIIPGLSRCLGIGIVGERQGGKVSGLAAIHMTPFDDMKKAGIYFCEFIDKVVEHLGVSMFIFAGGRIDNEVNRRFYKLHNEVVVEPLSEKYKQAICVKFSALPTTVNYTDLLLTGTYAKVAQKDDSFVESIGVLHYS